MLSVCYRVASYAEALWKIPNLRPARFHALGDPPTQYVTLHPLGAWAELIRNARLPRSELDVAELRVRLWVLRIDLERLVHLDFDTVRDHGIAAEALVSDDQTRCRELGRRLRAERDGIVYPSSALPGTACVCLFGERLESPYLEDPVDANDVPTTVAADDGAPPRSLLPRVRLHGEPHAGLLAHLDGAQFLFDEPSA